MTFPFPNSNLLDTRMFIMKAVIIKWVLLCLPVDLYLIFEKSSCKIKFDKLDFQPAKINFEIDFCRLHRGDFSEIKYRSTGGRGCLPGQIQPCRLTIKNSLQSIDVGDLCKNVENEDLIDCTDRPKVVQICANRCVLSGSE